MLIQRRYLILVLALGLVFSYLYLFVSWPAWTSASGRSVSGRLLGLLAVATFVATCGSYAWQRQRTYSKHTQDEWHARLAGLSLWLVFLHTGLRFGNKLALLALMTLLVTVASGVAVRFYDRKLERDAVQTVPTTPTLTSAAHDVRLRQRWLTVHVAATASLLTFLAVHILSIFYY